jgi:UV DNA damage endonuclease
VGALGIRLGYACVNTRLPSSARTLRLAGVTPDRLRGLIAGNLDALEAVLRWNAEHDIRVFRLTSNLIPFESHPANTLAWWEEFAERLDALGGLVRREELRLSTHPGQFTVLSSARPAVVSAAVAELEYHDRLLTALGLDESHKTVLHVGGGGAEPDAADDRFAAGFERLSEGARRRLVLENDERRALCGVLALAGRLGVPVVLDVFHHRLAPSLAPLGVRELVLLAGETWSPRDGRQEVHFSTQEPGRRPGAHASTIDLEAFARFAEEAGDLPLDCILEVKDKERSVLRARESLRRRGPDAGAPVSPPGSRWSRERAPRGQRRRTA